LTTGSVPFADTPAVDPLVVDTHCHIVVPEMLAATVPDHWRPEIVREQDGRQVVLFRGRRLTSVIGEFTDVEVMLGQAAEAGVNHLLLSPWIMLCPVETGLDEALRICRIQNEGLARAAARPSVSALGAVPLQDADAAARELATLMRVPGLCGAEVPASVAGIGLGDDRFLPFWEAAEATGALIFVHPTTRGLPGQPALDARYLWNSVGNPLETTITAAHLATAGVLERFPRLRILLAHGGGGLHAVRGRLRRAHEVRPEAAARAPVGPDNALRRFYYDSLTHDQALLAGLVGYAGAEHVLLGSDRPFDMGTDDPAGEVRALGLDEADEQLILGGNAARLLGLPAA
jgi:aminocarboxymuconate-semialdehyde decarboxylase